MKTDIQKWKEIKGVETHIRFAAQERAARRMGYDRNAFFIVDDFARTLRTAEFTTDTAPPGYASPFFDLAEGNNED